MSQVLTDGNDNIGISNNGAQVVYALDGNDRVYGGNTSFGNYWYGGNGDDALLYQQGGWIQAYGGEGSDTIHGGSSSTDWLYGDDGVDLLVSGEFDWAQAVNAGTITPYLGETSGNDYLDGGQGSDAIYGFDGDDIIYGGENSDRGTIIVPSVITVNATMVVTAGLYGGDGDDHIDGGSGGDDLYGGADDDTLLGGDGDDFLAGDTGADRMDGGAGDDTYVVDDAGDSVTEAFGNGDDVIYSSIDYALSAYNDIEVLRTTNVNGTTDLSLTGNYRLQTLIMGNAGDNMLNDGGSAGADTLQGREGNDTYVVHNAGAVIVEASGQGTDSLYSSVSYTLATNVSIESLRTISSGATTKIDLNGNNLSQVVTGNHGENRIDGKSGSDTLTGRGGADTFAFTTSLGGGNVDAITDFNVLDDTILLSHAIFTGLAAAHTLAASAFNIGAAAADASDRIIYDDATGALYFDADGLGGASATQFATVSQNLAMTYADFYVS